MFHHLNIIQMSKFELLCESEICHVHKSHHDERMLLCKFFREPNKKFQRISRKKLKFRSERGGG